MAYGMKNAQRPRPKVTTPPTLSVEDGQLILNWPPGDKPPTLVITTAGYEAMIGRINFMQRRIEADEKVVAAARQIIALLPNREPAEDQPAD